MTYALKRYPRMMHITNSDYHAIFNDGRWELYDDDRLFAYADNGASAEAKLLDAFEDAYRVAADSE